MNIINRGENMDRLKKFWNDNKRYILTFVILVVIFNIRLPYYVNAPGGTIDITNRLSGESSKKINGSLNLLYVTEFQGTIPTVLMSYMFKDWDLEKSEEVEFKGENGNDVYNRNRLMLDNSVKNATYVAYKYAGKDVKLTNIENVVIANTRDNGLEIGDVINKVEGKEVSNLEEIREVLKSSKGSVNIDLTRDNKSKNIDVKLDSDNKLGTVIMTNYDIDTGDDLDIKFTSRESGSSGGMMLTLTIYSAISDEDLIKGRKIAGTGTIDIEGNVGEIDGIKYKIMGAYKKGVDVVLVPSANYKEAMEVKRDKDYDMEIVEVKTFEDVINYLRGN